MAGGPLYGGHCAPLNIIISVMPDGQLTRPSFGTRVRPSLKYFCSLPECIFSITHSNMGHYVARDLLVSTHGTPRPSPFARGHAQEGSSRPCPGLVPGTTRLGTLRPGFPDAHHIRTTMLRLRSMTVSSKADNYFSVSKGGTFHIP